MLRCPKCLEELIKEEHCYRCQNNHCYDIAKQGYVNLILANQKHSLDPGDNKEQLNSRDNFLNKGYYQPLADRLVEVITKYGNENDVLLDAGCGTGYYLNHIINHVNKDLTYLATDISKYGVSLTARKCKDATCFVGNVFHLAINDGCLDILMSVFTPYSSEEFSRVVKKGGYVIAVNPGKNHLFGLKQIVYDNPYYNEDNGYDLTGFTLVQQDHVEYERLIETNDDINALWKMMPYYHTTSKQDSNKLLVLNQVQTSIDFLVSVYRKD